MNGSLDFLAGGGEMGARIRAMDWSRTPLGPPERWPQSLRSAVSILLPSKAQIALFWGPELITLYNDAYVPVFGEKHPRALGLPIREAWSELWGAGLRELFERVLYTGEAYWASDHPFYLQRHGYPEETFFDVSYDPVRDESGAVGGLFCIVRDTTRRILGERRMRVLRDLAAEPAQARSVDDACRLSARVLASVPEDVPFAAVYLLDEEGTTARLAATARVEAGHPAAPRETERDRGPWPFAAAHVVDGLAARFSAVPPGPWPEPPHCAMVLPLARGAQERPLGALVLGISARLAFDDEYRDFFGLVAGQVAASIASARASEEERRRTEALAELDRAKTTFFSNVSHEFRTPLTLMLGPTEDALADATAPLPPAQRERLEVARRSALRLQKLVNTLLDFSRIEAGRAQAVYEPVDLGPLTADLASSFRSAAQKAGLALHVDCPPLGEPAYVDRDMWEKVVLNLLSNALKFTFEGEIAVAVRRAGERFELAVRDTGIGIPESELPHLFERFRRVEGARSRTHEGTGIGLALVKELVGLHGGSVGIESAPGRGTCVTVALPAGRAHLPAERIHAARTLASTALGAAPFVEEALGWVPDAPRAAPRTVPDGPRARVVWADDNADMREYVRRLLGEAYDVEAVADGEAALRAVRARRPDLVLADVMMPRLDGFGLLAALRADPSTRTLPVVLLSARAGEEARLEGLAAGADDYLVKPFSAKELLARMAARLEIARIRREAEGALRQRGAQFKTLLDQAPLGVFLVDADFRIREVNPVALPAFGDLADRAEGSDFETVVRAIWEPRYADEVVAIFRRTLATGEPYYTPERAEYRIDRQATEYYEWRVDRIPLPDGGHGVVCYFRDVSTHVLARKALEESRAALEQADRRKDQFLATLAHELRNPLAPIRNAVQILMREGPDDPRLRWCRSLIERQVTHLTRLIDDLLDVSRITHNRLELRREQIDLADALQAAVESSAPVIEERGHRLKVVAPDAPVHLDADVVRLAQVFMNLLVNAAKYTEPGGEIELVAEVAPAADGRPAEAVVRVRDTGVGIPPDQLERVFDLFFQADGSLSRAQAGLGIGLSLVRWLVALHGGSVTAHSDGPGKGSEFVVRLPALAAAPSATVVAPAEALLRAPRRRVLVVDDLRDSADSLATLLRIAGHEVRTAYDGLQALDLAEDFRPDVVLLDIGMPGIDGYETCRRLRGLPSTNGALVVAMTGWSGDAVRRGKAEFDAHLVKPVDLAALERLLCAGRASA